MDTYRVITVIGYNNTICKGSFLVRLPFTIYIKEVIHNALGIRLSYKFDLSSIFSDRTLN